MRRGGGLDSFLPVGLAAGLLAFAIAGAPLYGSSAGSAALGRQLDETCRSATALELPVPVGRLDPNRQRLPPGTHDPALVAEATRIAPGAEERLAAIAGALRHVAAPRRMHVTNQRAVAPNESQYQLTVLHTTGAEEALALAPLGPGEIALSDTNMRVMDVAIGDRITIRGRYDLTVAQRFDDVPPDDVPDFWCGWTFLFELNTGGEVPPPSAIATPDTVAAVARAAMEADLEEFGEAGSMQSASELWIGDEYRLTTDPLTLAEGRAALASFQAVPDAFRADFPEYPAEFQPGQLPAALARADSLADTVNRSLAPVLLTAVVAVTVVLVAAAVLLARVRHTELRLFAVRGVAPWRVARGVSLGVAGGIVAGAAAGFALAWSAVSIAGPSPALEPAALRRAALGVGVAVVVAVPLVAGVVAWVGDRSVDHTRRPHRARWSAALAVLGLAVLAAVAYRRLDRDGGIRTFGVEARGGSLLAMGFPLFALLVGVASAALVIAALTPPLRLSGRRLGRATRLGWRRVVLEAGPLAAIVTAVALAVGCFATARALADAGERQLADKAEVYVGSDLAVTLFDDPPDRLTWSDRTTLQLVAPGRVDGSTAQLVGVDRATFDQVARLRGDAADRSLADLVAALDPAAATPSRRPAALAVGTKSVVGARVAFTGTASSDEVEFEIIAVADFFPGFTNGSEMYVVDRSTVESAVDFPTRVLLVRDPPTDALVQLHAAGVRTGITRSVDTAFDGSAYTGLRWSFVPLGVLGLLFAVIALALQLLVIAARASTRRATHAVMRHTQFGTRDVLIASVVETVVPLGVGTVLGGVVASIATRIAVPRLDPMPNLQPLAQFAVPWAAFGVAAIVIPVWALVIAALITRATVRLEPMEVLHGDT
jgi:hypothetical protein